MSQQDLVRFPARLQPEIHENLVAYAQQQGYSINAAMNVLLKFALSYGLKGRNEHLDKSLPDQNDNLQKASYFVDKGILDDIVKEFGESNSEAYLEYIQNQFKSLNAVDRKLLSDVAYSLAQKKISSE